MNAVPHLFNFRQPAFMTWNPRSTLFSVSALGLMAGGAYAAWQARKMDTVRTLSPKLVYLVDKMRGLCVSLDPVTESIMDYLKICEPEIREKFDRLTAQQRADFCTYFRNLNGSDVEQTFKYVLTIMDEKIDMHSDSKIIGEQVKARDKIIALINRVNQDPHADHNFVTLPFILLKEYSESEIHAQFESLVKFFILFSKRALEFKNNYDNEKEYKEAFCGLYAIVGKDPTNENMDEAISFILNCKKNNTTSFQTIEELIFSLENTKIDKLITLLNQFLEAHHLAWECLVNLIEALANIEESEMHTALENLGQLADRFELQYAYSYKYLIISQLLDIKEIDQQISVPLAHLNGDNRAMMVYFFSKIDTSKRTQFLEQNRKMCEGTKLEDTRFAWVPLFINLRMNQNLYSEEQIKNINRVLKLIVNKKFLNLIFLLPISYTFELPKEDPKSEWELLEQLHIGSYFRGLRLKLAQYQKDGSHFEELAQVLYYLDTDLELGDYLQTIYEIEDRIQVMEAAEYSQLLYPYMLDSATANRFLEGAPKREYHLIKLVFFLSLYQEQNDTHRYDSLIQLLSRSIRGDESEVHLESFEAFLQDPHQTEFLTVGGHLTHVVLYRILKEGPTLSLTVFDGQLTCAYFYNNIQPHEMKSTLEQLMQFCKKAVATEEIYRNLDMAFNKRTEKYHFKNQKQGTCAYKCLSKYLHTVMGHDFYHFKVWLSRHLIEYCSAIPPHFHPLPTKVFTRLLNEARFILEKREAKLSLLTSNPL